MSAFTSPPDLPIAGIIPFSATDWPGHLTITVFTQGCPLRCPYCHNPALQEVRPGEGFPFELLEQRRGLIDAVVISGGEPTMHSGLGNFIAAVHAHGYPVGLHTSGYRPTAIAALLASGETTPDWVGLDLKCLPASSAAVGLSHRAAAGSWTTLEQLTEAEVPLQARTTIWPGSVVEAELPLIQQRAAAYGHQLVVQHARGVDSHGRFHEVLQ